MESEFDAMCRAEEDVREHLADAGYEPERIGAFFDRYADEFRQEVYARGYSDGIEKLLKNTCAIPVRIELLSNYDCINSHWFESQGGFSYEESYFGDMVDALRLNPKKVKQLLLAHGEKARGRFPDRKSRDGLELVSYEQFYEELINSSCAATLLTFAATI
jgi:hypothetical protein